MPGHLPSLDTDALAKLRTLVQAMHRNNGRSVPLRELVELAGDAPLDAGVTIDFKASRQLGEPMIVSRMGPNHQPAEKLAVLSRRESEVASLIADGLSNKQIARRLFISLATVKDHVHRILAKTGLSNRASVAAAVSDHGPGSEAKTQNPILDPHEHRI